MDFTKSSLTEKLLQVAYKFNEEFDRIDDENQNAEKLVSDIQDKINNERQAILSPIFGNKKTSSHCGYDITVFCKNKSEVKDTIEKALNLGYSNISSYIPKVSDGTKYGSMDDPEFDFAVDIRHSNELIIGNIAKKALKILEPYTNLFKDKIIYTYAYQGDIRFTFRDHNVATTIHDKLSELYDSFNKQTKESNTKTSVQLSFTQERLDNYIVRLQFNL